MSENSLQNLFNLQQKLRRLLFVLLNMALLVMFSLAVVNASDGKNKKLDHLNTEISKLKTTITTKQKSKSQINQQLRQIESKIGLISRSISDISAQIKQSEYKLKLLKNEKRELQIQLSAEYKTLSNQIYSSYLLGKQQKTRLLFSQQDPNVLQRNLTYFDFLSQARLKLINSVEDNINQVLTTENKINKLKSDLKISHLQKVNQNSSLKAGKQKRQKIIATLNIQLKSQGRYLIKLENDALKLKQLINSIPEMRASDSSNRILFAKLRGKLPWPVKGNIKKLFGRKKPPSNLRWQGIKIIAPNGKQVRAISHGKIAFADWLRGLGNLIIIDHGNGFLSLYGHNETLYKSAGDWVEPGDIISSIGNSGGESKSALYFEIRKNGKPQNPSKWCS